VKYSDMIEPALPTERDNKRQVKNNAGGYVFEVSPMDRLRRFLVLGTEGGSFYASQRDLTKQNVDFLKDLAREFPADYLAVLRKADQENIAPRHSTVLLALAVLFTQTPGTVTEGEGDARVTKRNPVRADISMYFTDFVRTGTHLFEFIDYATTFRGWGRGLRTLISSWYAAKDADALAYQIVKYRQRGGWSHRDVLRQAHPKVTDPASRRVLDYAAHGVVTIEDAQKSGKPTTVNEDVLPEHAAQFEAVKAGKLTPIEADMLTWEMLPTDSLTDPKVWSALIAQERLPFTALLRNLGRMTSIGVFDEALVTRMAVSVLKDPERVRRARIHPFNALTALKTYSSGQGFRGSLTWRPKQAIVDALDGLFYEAFQNVETSGKRICIALDISGSMGMGRIQNSNITAREGSVAMAMATLAADQDTTDTIAFTSGGWKSAGNVGMYAGFGAGITELGLSPRRRLDDIVRETAALPMGGTDCALPILWAGAQKKVYDAFVVYTDNETWAGKVQPMEALRAYRKKFNPEARLVVVGMTATNFTIADPEDSGSLDITGFDASAPAVISNFVAGKF
jgi:60 kDa SS-A/Ro ribonucleoprotein